MPVDVILVSMHVSSSLYTNIPQEEGISSVYQAYQDFYDNKPPIPVGYLREMLSLILKKALSNSVEKITYKTTVLLWERKWPQLLLVYLWPTLRKKSLKIKVIKVAEGLNITVEPEEIEGEHHIKSIKAEAS